MRHWLHLAVVVFLVVAIKSGHCTEYPRITLKGESQPICDIVRQMADVAGLSVSYAPTTDQQVIVPAFSISDVPFEVALRNILRVAQLSYKIDGSDCAIFPVGFVACSTDDALARDHRPTKSPPIDMRGAMRFEVRQAHGNPLEVIPGAYVGEETWVYSDRRIVFHGSYVVAVSVPVLRVNMGRLPPSEYIPDESFEYLAVPSFSSDMVRVRGYFRKDGTYVNSYWRHKPGRGHE